MSSQPFPGLEVRQGPAAEEKPPGRRKRSLRQVPGPGALAHLDPIEPLLRASYFDFKLFVSQCLQLETVRNP